MTLTNPANHLNVIAVEDGLLVRIEGLDTPAYLPLADIENVIDKEGDLWKRNTDTDFFYLPESPYFDSPDEADSTLEEIEAEHGIDFFNEPSIEVTDRPEPTPVVNEPLFVRGDIVQNLRTGREALILSSLLITGTDIYLYTIIEKGYLFPPGCSAIKGGGTFPEAYFAPTDQRFSEEETALLVMAYAL